MELQINKKTYQVDAEVDTPLLWVLRDELGLTGTKYGCGLAQCGACSVLVDGVAMRSCVVPIEGLNGRDITTIESIEDDEVGKRVVQAWIQHQVPQCGYCQSGQVMAATALLKQISHPTNEQIASAMINLCRCGTYNAINAAVHEVAGTAVVKTESNMAADTPPVASQIPGSGVAAAAAAALVGVGALVMRRQANKAKDDGEQI